MRTDLTDITLVVDRSGSMEEIKEDAQGGVNAFISRQAQEPGEALFTLVQFDTEYEFVHKGVPISEVAEYELVPRGMTALLDAVGRAINETGRRLAAMPEQERPGLVIFVIVTDGHENSSHEFSKARIKAMIERQQDVYNWHFTFLGADQDAFDEAAQMGIHTDGVAMFAACQMAGTYDATASKVARMRKQRRSSQKVDNKFTEEELGKMT